MNTQEITVDDFLQEVPKKNSKFLKFEDGKTKRVKILSPLRPVKRMEKYKENDPKEYKYVDVYDYESKEVKLLKIGASLQRAIKAGIEAYDNDFTLVDFNIVLNGMNYNAIPLPTKLKDESKLERLNILDVFKKIDDYKNKNSQSTQEEIEEVGF